MRASGHGGQGQEVSPPAAGLKGPRPLLHTGTCRVPPPSLVRDGCESWRGYAISNRPSSNLVCLANVTPPYTHVDTLAVRVMLSAQVCRYLALMPSALSLHDIIITVLDGVHDLVLSKFGIQFYPVLAVIHGTSSPAVLFAQRPNVVNAIGGSGGGGSFRGGSDRLPHLAAVTQAYESSSGLALQRPNAAGMTGLNSTPGFEATPSLGAVTAGNCGRQEPSRIRAIKISLAHTLLLQAAR